MKRRLQTLYSRRRLQRVSRVFSLAPRLQPGGGRSENQARVDHADGIWHADALVFFVNHECSQSESFHFTGNLSPYAVARRRVLAVWAEGHPEA